MGQLAAFTTFGIGGDCEDLVIARTESELIAAVAGADEIGQPVLIIGGGSNLLLADTKFSGRVVVVATKGNSYEIDACSGGMLQVAAGEDWDEFVAFTLSKNLANLESLSGIPGTVGAAPIQNIGAYGHEVGSYIARVRTYDRVAKEIRTLFASDLKFDYRTSLLKENPNRYLVLDVTFQLRRGYESLPIAYSELANSLGVSMGARVATGEVRAAVLELRRGKGMLAGQLKSAGSFFINPIVDAALAESLPSEAPRYAADSGKVKLSAAWLIANAGIAKGDALGGAGVSPFHVLALINSGNAKASDVISLAKKIQSAVLEKFAVKLMPEVNLIGVELN